MGCGVLIDVNELVRQLEKASPNGVATLDSNTKVPKVQINGVLSAADVGAIATGGTAGKANQLTTPRTIAGTGDASYSVSFDGSANVSGEITLADSGVVAGTYNALATQVRPFTVDAKGRITATGVAIDITPPWSAITGTPNTLSGYGITNALPLSGGTIAGDLISTSATTSTSTTTGAIRTASLGVTGAIFAGTLNSVGLVAGTGYIGTDTGMYRLDTNTYTKRFLSFNLYGSPSSSSGYRTQSDGWGLVLEQLATTGECRLRVSSSSAVAGSINTLANVFSYLPSNSTFSFGGVSIVAGTAALFMNSNQIISNRRTGWAAPTGTSTRTTFTTSTVTLSELAERVKALIDDLTTHGLIGA